MITRSLVTIVRTYVRSTAMRLRASVLLSVFVSVTGELWCAACQVVKCAGVSGSNAEYVTRLADFVRRHIPRDDDDELFQLDAHVRRLLGASSSHVPGRDDLAPAVTHARPSSVVEQCELTVRDAATRRRSLVSVLAAG